MGKFVILGGLFVFIGLMIIFNAPSSNEESYTRLAEDSCKDFCVDSKPGLTTIDGGWVCECFDGATVVDTQHMTQPFDW